MCRVQSGAFHGASCFKQHGISVAIIFSGNIPSAALSGLYPVSEQIWRQQHFLYPVIGKSPPLSRAAREKAASGHSYSPIQPCTHTGSAFELKFRVESIGWYNVCEILYCQSPGHRGIMALDDEYPVEIGHRFQPLDRSPRIKLMLVFSNLAPSFLAESEIIIDMFIQQGALPDCSSSNNRLTLLCKRKNNSVQ